MLIYKDVKMDDLNKNDLVILKTLITIIIKL